jgi:hypothetical protein
VKPAPCSACARHLLVQRHLHESGGIWLCLFLPVPPRLLSSPFEKGAIPPLLLPETHTKATTNDVRGLSCAAKKGEKSDW